VVGGDHAFVDGQPLAAVEPARAQAGDEAGECRHCDDEVPPVSLVEQGRKSFREWLGRAQLNGMGYPSDTPQRGIDPLSE
jgi:hypothetical protein